ncbi:MAG: endonuclease/exonuclease/phosphatase family protein [Bacteroidales bacterium]|nr:endonuclease/exonuclease/phosphatase family protein [Bacteroidales bacterium]
MKKLSILLLAVLTVCVLATSCERSKNLRLMYWNIQNGMWDGQPDNYDRFVEYVKSFQPDICVWCEAQSIFIDGTDTRCDTADRYLVKNWDKLAARYGHKYTYIGGHRDSYPQAITSRFPIENVARIVGVKPDSVVAHAAGWARIQFAGKELNIVTTHTYPMSYAFNVPKHQRDSSAALNGGDYYRAMEMEYVCKHTVLTDPDAADHYWMLMGDFNSLSRLDKPTNGYDAWPDDDTEYLTQDYILNNTPLIDVVREKHPGEPLFSMYKNTRLDYVYCSKPLYDRVTRADIIKDEYTTPVRDSVVKNFFHPSDHLPFIIDFKF